MTHWLEDKLLVVAIEQELSTELGYMVGGAPNSQRGVLSNLTFERSQLCTNGLLE